MMLDQMCIRDRPCAMVLGDNIFYGNNFSNLLKAAVENAQKGRATVFFSFSRLASPSSPAHRSASRPP